MQIKNNIPIHTLLFFILCNTLYIVIPSYTACLLLLLLLLLLTELTEEEVFGRQGPGQGQGGNNNNNNAPSSRKGSAKALAAGLKQR